MTIADHQLKEGNTIIPYRLYEPETPSKNFLIFFHGRGEAGPPDGSQLDLVENHGWPRLAKGIRPDGMLKGSIEFPFNIIAPQVEESYDALTAVIIDYCVRELRSKSLIATGLSLGGMAVIDLLVRDKNNRLKAIAPVCGKGNEDDIHSMRPIDGFAWHGMEDQTVDFNESINFYHKYNQFKRPGKILVKALKNVGHDVWHMAYSMVPGNRDLYDWVVQKF